MDATKRPWAIEGPKHDGYVASIVGADGHLIVNLGDGGNGRDVQLANAELIVRAVNTFDQAREALKDACLTYSVHGDQPPQKWLDALAAMEVQP